MRLPLGERDLGRHSSVEPRRRYAAALGRLALGDHEVRGDLGLRTLDRALELLQRTDQVDPTRVVQPAAGLLQRSLPAPDLVAQRHRDDIAAASVRSDAPEIPHT